MNGKKIYLLIAELDELYSTDRLSLEELISRKSKIILEKGSGSLIRRKQKEPKVIKSTSSVV